MSFLRDAMLVAGKDLRIERRSRVALQQIVPFGAIVVVLFAFALDSDPTLLRQAAPGLFWAAVLLAVLLAVGRSFSIEEANRARDGLRLCGLDGGSIFFGKAAAVAVEMLLLEVIVGAAVVVLYDVSIRGVVILVCAALAATVGLAATGTVYGVLAGGLRARETLVPLLILPAVMPVMMGATRSFQAALQGTPGDAWPWVQLLVRVRGAGGHGGHGRVRTAVGGSMKRLFLGDHAVSLSPSPRSSRCGSRRRAPTRATTRSDSCTCTCPTAWVAYLAFGVTALGVGVVVVPAYPRHRLGSARGRVGRGRRRVHGSHTHARVGVG